MSVEQWDTTAAIKLETAIRRANKVMRKPNPKTWAAQLSALRLEVGKPRLKAALLWYTKNLGQPYVPAAYSAAGFVEKFQGIEDAMQRADGPSTPKGKPVTITPIAMQILGDPMPIWWNPDKPGCTLDDQLQFVQITHDNYADYRTRLGKEYFARAEDDEWGDTLSTKPPGTPAEQRLLGLLKMLWYDTHPCPVEFARFWLENIHFMARRWRDWPGGLPRKAWRFTNERWAKARSDECDEYTGLTGQWAIVTKVLYGG